jgi:hypothetical protein
MNENPLADPPTPPGLPCNTIVYRAAMDESWFSADNAEVDAIAFHRRERRDPTGLSIGRHDRFYRGHLTRPIAGVISIHVGHVRDVGDELGIALDVAIDADPHGNILGLPFAKSPTRREAERVASLLARRAARPHEIFNPPRL